MLHMLKVEFLNVFIARYKINLIVNNFLKLENIIFLLYFKHVIPKAVQFKQFRSYCPKSRLYSNDIVNFSFKT